MPPGTAHIADAHFCTVLLQSKKVDILPKNDTRFVFLTSSKSSELIMTDAKINDGHWVAFKSAANCFIPRLIAIGAKDDGPRPAHIAKSYNSNGSEKSGISSHIVGSILARKPVTADTAFKVLTAYSEWRAGRDAFPELDRTNIVAALFGLPTLQTEMTTRGLTPATLSTASGVSIKAIDAALHKTRVTGGIAYALHKALNDDTSGLPPLNVFATSDPSNEYGNKKIPNAPFSQDDLSLPLPGPAPYAW